MKRVGISVLLLILLATSLGAAEAAPKVGGDCTKAGSLTHIAEKTYVCTLVGKKKVWRSQPSSQSRTSSGATSTQETSNNSSTQVIPDPILSDRSLFADISTCKVSSPLMGGNLGFPREASFIPTMGKHKGVVLFVDFTDVKGDASLFDEWRLHQIPTMEKTFSTMSYGKLTYALDLIPQIFHINKDSVSYLLNTPHDQPANPNAAPYLLIHDAMASADAAVDFSQYDFVNVVTPTTSNILYEGATGAQETFDGKKFTQGTFSTEREYLNQPQKANWLVHETGHLMGLIHNYNTADTQGVYKAAGFQLPAWDAMTYPLTVAPDFLGWSKFILGWVADNQVDCLASPITSTTTHLLSPIGEASSGSKIVVVKLDSENLLVVESRRKSALDNITPSQEGVIVYKVNMRKESGQGAVELLFNKANIGTFPGDIAKFGAGAIFTAGYGNLRPGEVLKTQGFAITYVKRAATGDFVSISKA